ncbi:MAG: hypothetical protein LBT01_02790 [Spirochaetaceae bacterium]|jgi:hypothetical protein|nr:hypothetical protein [Spirochaetaceae bacterium]
MLRLLFLYLFIGTVALSFAQQLDNNAPYQIPQTIYIGDRGRLVYPLDGFFSNQEDGELPLDNLPESGEIVINAVQLNNGRLVVDFQAFKTGIISLPPIVVGEKTLSGLEVHIASILEGQGGLTVLSAAATPLSAPGTLWIISAFVLITILGIVILLLFLFRSGNVFLTLKRRIKHKRMIRQTQRAIKRLKMNLDKETIGTKTALSDISNELRIFIDKYFNIHCRAMVPQEFLDITFPEDSGASKKYSPEYFYQFFTNCDTIRFSGKNIAEKTVRGIIAEVEDFISSITIT